jgi:hypothetical protein
MVRKAVLAALELPKQEFDPSVLLEELKLLLLNLGIETVGTAVQKRDKQDPAFLVGKGKAEELGLFCKSAGATLIVCNENLSPGQKNSLQKCTGVEKKSNSPIQGSCIEIRHTQSLCHKPCNCTLSGTRRPVYGYNN